MKVYVITFLAVFVLSGCSNVPRNEYNTSYDTQISRIIGQSVMVSMESKSNKSGPVTTMIGVGGTFIMVPTGGQGPSYGTLQAEEYVLRLTQLLMSIRAFSTAEYIPTKPEVSYKGYALSISFNNTYK